MSKQLCKGKCGNSATYKGWCRIKWKSKNRFGVACPVIEKNRGLSISKFRIKEAKQGKNPMQNPEISAKNHSPERNRKAAETLKKLGKSGLLPQQRESKMLKDKRRKNVSRALKILYKEGRLPIQLESVQRRKERHKKISDTLKLLGNQGKLPIQNMTEEEKIKFSKKMSKTLREGIRTGRIKLSKSWKKVPYKNMILRSEWEKTVAKFLDKGGFTWEYESLRIPYWDSERKIRATTIPDFYIPEINSLIEVKSNADFNSKRTKDKIKAMKKQGFNAFLFGRKEIQLIREDENKFLNYIKGRSK